MEIELNCISNIKLINKKKHSNALLPNLIHYLDSLLCMEVLKEAYLSGINLTTVHDSFYVNIIDYEKIKDIYRKSYINLLVKDLLKII